MNPEGTRRRTIDRGVAFAAALAAVAGSVDAIGFTRLFGVFPANQSGNAVLLGIAIGDASAEGIWRPALALAAFVLGIVLGLALRRWIDPSHRVPALLGIETALLVLLALGAGRLPDTASGLSGLREAILLALAAGAMGIQTDAIRRAAGVTLVTTYETGAIDRIAESAAGVALDDTRAIHVRRGPLAVLSLVLGCYVGGAAIGAAVVEVWNRGLWVPCSATAALAIIAAVISLRDDDA